MGSVIKRGNSWYIKWKDGSNLPRREVTAASTKREAELLLAEEELRAERQRRGLEATPVRTTRLFGEVCEWWLENGCSANSRDTEAPRLRKHVLGSKLGAMPMKSVGAEAIRSYLAQMLGDGAKPATANKLRGTLLSVFKAATEGGMWSGPSPIEDVKPFAVDDEDHITLAADEVPLVLAHVPDEWRNFFATAIYLALRKGELCGLLKANIDWESMTIRVAHSYAFPTTKNKKRATLPIPTPLVRFLRDAVSKSPSKWVFPKEDGSMRTKESDPQKILRTALTRAGLVDGYEHICRRCKSQEKPGHTQMRPDQIHGRCEACGMRLWVKGIPRDMVFHDLRHTTATLLIRAGVPLAHVQRIMRHASISTTIGIYGHLDVSDLRGPIEQIAPMSDDLGAQLVASNMGPEIPVPTGVHMDEARESLNEKLGRLINESAELQDGRSRVRTYDPCRVKASDKVSQASSGVSNLRHRSAKRSVSDSQQTPSDTSVTHRSGPHGVHLRVVSFDERLLGVKEIAGFLKVSTATVYRLVEAGALPHSRVSSAIRVSESDLVAFLKGGGK